MTTISVDFIFPSVSRLIFYNRPAISLFFLILYFSCGCWWGDEPCGARYCTSPSTYSLVFNLTAVVGMQISDLSSEQVSHICSNPVSDALQNSFSNSYLKTHAFFLWLKRYVLFPSAHAAIPVIMGEWQDIKLVYLLSCGDCWKSWGCPTELRDSGNKKSCGKRRGFLQSCTN